jgi:hypothetical protein
MLPHIKNMILIIPAMVCLAVSGCTKNDSCGEGDHVAPDDNVEMYIGLLKQGEYDNGDLPPFTYSSISALLEYRNETQMITNFPHNPISSFYMTECRLGIYVLWTIESIRAVAIDSEYLIMRFPSQNPALGLRDSEGFNLVFDLQAQIEAARAYYNWWYSHNCKDFDEFKNIDPLARTPYKWN